MTTREAHATSVIVRAYVCRSIYNRGWTFLNGTCSVSGSRDSYRIRGDGQPEYAVFRRTDLAVWQAIAGGGEDLETPADAARREAWEEAGLPLHASLHSLRALAMIPATHFLAAPEWGTAVTEIPEHAFAIRAPDGIVHLSAEHTEVVWLPYSEASARFHWESNRAALIELHEWLTRTKRD